MIEGPTKRTSSWGKPKTEMAAGVQKPNQNTQEVKILTLCVCTTQNKLRGVSTSEPPRLPDKPRGHNFTKRITPPLPIISWRHSIPSILVGKQREMWQHAKPAWSLLCALCVRPVNHEGSCRATRLGQTDKDDGRRHHQQCVPIRRRTQCGQFSPHRPPPPSPPKNNELPPEAFTLDSFLSTYIFG